MKFLLCHNYYQQHGGEDESFESEARLLESYGHGVVCYTRHNDDVRRMSRWTAARRTLFNPETYKAIRSLIRRARPDLVHCTNTFPLISPSIHVAARDEGIPVVQSLRNYRWSCANGYFHRAGRVCEDCLGKTVPWPAVLHGCYRGSRAASAVVAALQMRQRFRRHASRSVSVYFTPTRFARQKFIEGGLPAERIVVKPNFIEADPGVGDGRGEFFVFVGRLSPEKGIDTLLGAWSEWPEAPRLVVIGDGPLAGRVRQMAERHPRVEWLGRRSQAEVLSIVGDAACLVCPSVWYETFGRTVMEAYARGTPVIASDLGALAELVDAGRTGLLCAPGNVQALRESVSCLASNAADRARMRVAARAEYESKYTAEANIHLLNTIYERAMSDAPAMTTATHPLHGWSGGPASPVIESTGGGSS